MCLSRSGVRTISGFSRPLSTNGATALTSWVSRSSTDDTSARVSRHEFRPRRSTCWRSWSSRPSGKRWPWASASSGSSGACESSAAWVRPDASASELASTSAGGPCADEVVAPEAFVLAEQRARRRRHRPERRGLELHHVPVEVGRASHGLARVVDDEVEPRAGREDVPAETPRRSGCGAGRARRSRAGRPSRRSPAPGRSAARSRAGTGW